MLPIEPILRYLNYWFFQISDKPYEETGRVDTGVSDLLSFAELSCELPRVPVDIQYGSSPGIPTGGFLIELSNDGVNYSKNSSLFLVYDSKCMECTKTGDRTCKWKVIVNAWLNCVSIERIQVVK